MEKYRRMLRQALTSDLSPNKIAAQRGLSHHMVRRWLAIARSRNMTVPELDAMSHTELRSVSKPPASPRAAHIEPDWEVEAKLVRSGLSRAEAHADYEARVGGDRALKYRSYCDRLAAFVKTLDPPFFGLSMSPVTKLRLISPGTSYPAAGLTAKSSSGSSCSWRHCPSHAWSRHTCSSRDFLPGRVD